MQKIVLYILVLIVSAGCENQRPDTSRMKKEVEDRKIVRVTDGQLMEFAGGLGKSLLDSLQNTVTITGIWVKADTSIITSYAIKHELEIKLRTKETITKPSKEYEIFDAYLYNAEKKLPVEDNLQKINGDSILYTRPVMAPENVQIIAMWSVKMPKKILIKRFANVNPVKN